MAEFDLGRRDALVRVRGLQRSFRLGGRVVEVLRGLDLDVARGEFLAVTGRSGVGKSTLLHLLGCLDSPTAGEISIDGEQVSQYNGVQRAGFRNRRIGFVFQFHHLLPEFTALENVMIPALIRRMPRAEARRRARQELTQMGLGHRLDHKPGELAGGEQQRVALARALIGQPALLLLDEPTGNLDGVTAGAIHALIRDTVRNLQATCVVVTHDETLARVADRRLEMIDGTFEAPPGATTDLGPACVGENAR